MNRDELSDCGLQTEESYGLNPETGKWEKQDVAARCGEVISLVPFGFDRRFCENCAVRLGLKW